MFNLQQEMSGNKPREINIKLICPSLSKVTQVVAWDDQRIDLGFVARAFGLDPSSLRLNSHFIGRGVDLVASSVTWKSLLSFFSSKGLPTGKDQRDALVVTGKLCKVGLKPIGVVGRECLFHMRIGGHDSQHFQNGVGKMLEGEILNGQSCKRNHLLDDVNLFKKLKINEDKSDIHDKVDDLSGSIARSQFTCSYASKNLKRIREDETTAANYKRIR
ncbi:hypothetical protein AAZX31_16G092900 [Glycine max]|uniref:uncharacterized protein LOC114389683 isoform X2 n=1 Tax=Glycine soja TaxID=3848 RepID=UPI0003DE9788|nr:uncharacterized protein LOC114389683 isoform X2 [Glycine soja]XP_040866246.1 uncharacterized protein LOC100780719 isoform X2 [Glycine max]KAG4380045.1 hypothetical protein GLYMA_16G101000v4 [Glycine max]KAG4380048.1 hypothetical protein GLYMA_16G101000v4 [Glycine max]KAH1150790.1 hypothetical protein GYH30_044689 [Glycine max]KAH1150793.1 hypothetical protein GYH30_044689 [Glycine max]|eukprot:XP_006599225.1 uncharacterized protein LOC100780719 isoform X2 [Glycine max]